MFSFFFLLFKENIRGYPFSQNMLVIILSASAVSVLWLHLFLEVKLAPLWLMRFGGMML